MNINSLFGLRVFDLNQATVVIDRTSVVVLESYEAYLVKRASYVMSFVVNTLGINNIKSVIRV